MRSPLRVIYSAGPGDVIRTFHHWKAGRDDPSQMAMTYSGMFYDLCRDAGYSAYVIGSCERSDAVVDGQFRLVQRMTPFERGPGPLFYVGQAWAAVRLIISALWFRADVAVVACGTVSWIVMRLMPLFGIQVVASLHCVLWPPYRQIDAAAAPAAKTAGAVLQAIGRRDPQCV